MHQQVRKIGWALAVVLGAGALGGCRWFYVDEREEWRSDGDVGYVASGNLLVENGFQAGTMGDVSNYAGTAFRQDGFSHPGFSEVRLDSSGRGWWVMSGLRIRNATLDDLVPNVTYRSATSSVSEGGIDGAAVPEDDVEDDVEIDVVGCSGPQVDQWNFDNYAEQVEVEVEDVGGGVRRVFWRAWFRHEGELQETEGQFDYRTVN
jgi:hypothetical protein